jgi:hypothetical protein
VTSVPVYGIAGDKKIYLGRVFAEGETTQFSLKAPQGVTRLVLDPYETVLTAPPGGSQSASSGESLPEAFCARNATEWSMFPGSHPVLALSNCRPTAEH